VRGLGVFDVTYQVQHKPAGKSIIVEIGPDEYHEVFYERAPGGGGRFYPTQIVSASENQTLVWLREDTGGNRHGVEDLLFQLNSDGPTRGIWIPDSKLRIPFSRRMANLSLKA
jgi:hypothetical protein